jgi:tetratricopeptide (TPR) repeat protein
MSRKICFVLIILLVCGLHSAFAQYNLPEPVFHEGAASAAAKAPLVSVQPYDAYMDLVYLWDYIPANIHEPMIFVPLYSLAASASSDAETVEIPHNIRNNRFYLESIRLTKMAQYAYDEGDYDASAEYAAEAVRFAQLSDDFVAHQLKIKEANDTITAAKQRLDWAASSGASATHSSEYEEAHGFYEISVTALRAEEWDDAIEAANNVINILAYIETPGGKSLPARYTVQTWANVKDCLWNIAGRSWAYGDSFKWKLIYEANKDKLPDPNNPDLIEPGIVLDIPSIKGEVRQGMWEAGKSY